MTELIAKDYGLNDSQALTIEQAFAPKIAEKNGYIEFYEQILKAEITPELEKQAGDLRRKLVKVRTGIADIHKTQKAFFLAAGRFVDEWKNKETKPIEQMEENLKLIETFTERQEQERIAKLQLERENEVSKYSEVIPGNLGIMEQSVFDNYLTGLVVAYNARIEAEKKAEAERIEAERIEALRNARLYKTSRLIDFIENYDSIDFGIMTEQDYDSIVKSAIALRTKKEEEIEAQRIENEKLKKEAEAKEKARIEELRKIQEQQEKERKDAEAKIEAEKKERERLAAEIEAKKQAEIKEQKRIEAERKKAAAAPDKDKLIKLINDLYFTADLNSEEAKIVFSTIEQKFNGFKAWAIQQINSL